MNMTEEERQKELKSFFTSHSLFGMKNDHEQCDDEEFMQPTDIEKKSSINNWKNWLTQKSKVNEKVDQDNVNQVLSKKIRSMKYLDHLKQKRQKRIEIEQQLKNVESKGKKKAQNFFNKGLMSLIKRRASNEQPHLENFNGNEFNYYQLTKEVLHIKKHEIIKWTKDLYCKENRLISQQ